MDGPDDGCTGKILLSSQLHQLKKHKAKPPTAPVPPPTARDAAQKKVLVSDDGTYALSRAQSRPEHDARAHLCLRWRKRC